MNCTTARQQLLGSERPDRPGTALADHLLACSGCRTMQRRLLRVERDIRRLSVPPCPAPPGLLEQVLNGPPDGALVRTPERLRHNPDTTREGGRQKLALALALAASLAVFAIGWGIWPQNESPHRPISRVRKGHIDKVSKALHGTTNSRDSVERLTTLAEKEFATAKRATPEELADLATQFDWLLRDDLPYHAGQLPAGERAEVLKVILHRLQLLESEAARLYAARRGKPGASSLERIVAAVNEADRRLRQMT
jgi:hypothetical protein